MDLKEYVQPGVIALLTALIGGLWWKRTNNAVTNQNASADRQSRFEDNLQTRHDTLLTRIAVLERERDALKAELEQARTRLTVVQMFADGNEVRAIELAKESAFTDLHRPLRPRPAPQRPSPSDPFQAANPYAPPPRKRKP